VRAYAPEQVNQSTLRTLLAAAVRAPTAMHGEPWQFVIVQDRDTLKRLSDRAKETLAAEAAQLHPDRGSSDVFTQPAFNVFYDVGTLVVICAKTAERFASADCWLAAQNLMLAAHAMGLGTCVIGLAASVLNLPDVKHELGIPPDTTAVAPIIVGVPRGETPASARKDPQVVAWR
jgi:nitroreductase